MIKSGDKVLIVGDSWGLGEWSDTFPHRVVHNGLQQYLIDYGCKVYNVSQGGHSNRDSIKKLKNSIKGIEKDINKVFWFQTDPMRDLRPYRAFPKSLNEYMVCRTTLLENTYKELNDIGIKIHCIGGASKLQSSIRNYSNLIPLIDSVIEFLGCELIDIWVSDWIQHDLNIDDDFLKLLTELPYPRDTLSKEWFYPDGTHPNRHAHKKIFEYILTC